MTTRMLIDARHPEETRVAVVQGNRIEEFDFESQARKQIKGNIYLAKVTRVEPSLQAAFIDYGGNRHGFLAFSEIHPDYYQIPREDREALLREEQRLIEEHAEEMARSEEDAATARPADGEEAGEAGSEGNGSEGNGSEDGNGQPPVRPEDHGNTEEAGAEALRRRRMALRRRYKIQEVIRRRQVMLVQVVKEERGNKGAALTTYISLAGRYSVLMPNTANGGGISRKIANAADRKRLKSIMAELDLPPSMGAIVRTAGLERTKTEIRRDFDYLTRLWDEIRETTLSSSAPALIYEDSDLVKRAVRDIYTREIDEVLVDGERGFEQARSFMKLLMPSHARKVKPYIDPVPLFHRAGVESQLASLLNPVVQLRSGGYIVINSTEALVAIDVNSGRSTREYNIEETALKTNIEAAEEVARQLRLRDLAGLVVVDFIDMESNSNNRRVERALKEALKQDRARIQVGRISSFGLLEMSRQRLRTSVLEASTQTCPTCEGIGLIHTDGSAALAALRQLEDEAVKGRASQFRLNVSRSVAFYILNRKRAELSELEARYSILIEVMPDDSLAGGRATIDSSGPPPAEQPKMLTLGSQTQPVYDEADLEIEDDIEEEEEASTEAESSEERREGQSRRRRRRRGGRDNQHAAPATSSEDHAEAGDEADAEAEEQDAQPGNGDSEGPEAESSDEGERRRRRRRRRRGGRGRDGAEAGVSAEAADQESGETSEPEILGDVASGQGEVLPEAIVEQLSGDAAAPAEPAPEPVAAEPALAEAPAEAVVDSSEEPAAEAAPEPAPKPRRRRKAATAEAPAAEATTGDTVAEQPAEAPKPRRRRKTAAAEVETATATEASEATPAEAAPAEEPKPRARRVGRPRKKAADATETAPAEAEATAAADAPAQPAAAPIPADPAPVAPKPEAAVPTPAEPEGEATATGAEPAEQSEQAEQPTRRGWWQRTFGN